MGQLGETLRQARLDRGASLVDAEHDTHIRRRYLEALESEDLAALPPPVYTRGFIKSYARYLGLDPEATLDLFGPPRAREDRPAIRPATPRLSPARPASVRIFVAVAGLVLLLLLLVYLWTQYTSFVQSVGSADPSGGARATATASRPAGGPTGVEAPAVTPAASAPAAPVPAPPIAAGPSPAPERGIVVEARITERTWLEVWVDGAPQLQATLQAGTSRTFNANQSIRMRVGNAGGVEVTVNGQPQGPLGDRYQVKEFGWER